MKEGRKKKGAFTGFDSSNSSALPKKGSNNNTGSIRIAMWDSSSIDGRRKKRAGQGNKFTCSFVHRRKGTPDRAQTGR